MTIASTTNRMQYAGAGLTGPYAFNFRLFAATDLAVTKRSAAGTELTLAYVTDWTLATGTTIGDASGSITLAVALATGETLVLRRVPVLTQQTSLANGGPYFGKTIEDQFDRAAMIDQAQQEQLDRSFKLSPSLDPSGYSLAVGPPAAGKVLTGTATGIDWVTLDSGAVALPGNGRTETTLSAYLLNNAVFNVKSYAPVGVVIDDGFSDATSAFAAARARQVAAGGGIIWVPRATVAYLVSSLDASGVVSFVMWGEGERSKIQTTAAANITLALGVTAPGIESCELRDLWINGTATNLGGLALGTAAYYAAYTKLRGVRITGFTGVGAYGLSLNSVQELDVEDCRLQGNYDNVYRPNLGFVTSARFHGQRGYIGGATHRGVNIQGPISDLSLLHQVVESNARGGIYADGVTQLLLNTDTVYLEGNNGGVLATGTVAAAAGAATFSTSQAGQLANGDWVVVAGVKYKVSAFNGTTGCTLSGAPTFGAAAFRIADPGQIHISGAAGAYQQARVLMARTIWHIADANNPTSYQLSLDQTTRSVIAESSGVEGSGGILTTANTQAHFRDNALPGAVDFVAIYRALLGAITAEDTDQNGRRFIFRDWSLDSVHLKSTQQTPPGIAVHANAGTGATAVLTAGATDLRGQITLTPGSAAWVAGTQCTITFNRAFGGAPLVYLTPANHYASLALKDLAARAEGSGVTTATWTLTFGIAAAAANAQVWNYWVVE